MTASTKNYSAIVICKTFDEIKALKGRFPEHWHVVLEGGALAGYRADAIFVTPRVDTGSDWFICVARLRLWKSTSPVLRIELVDA